MHRQAEEKALARVKRVLAIGAILVSAPVVVACESGSDAISDQINEQVEGLQEQAGNAALDQLNETTGGKVDELQQTKEETLQQIDEDRKDADRAIREARRRADQARQEALSPAR